MCIYIYIHICAYIYVFVHIYIYITTSNQFPCWPDLGLPAAAFLALGDFPTAAGELQLCPASHGAPEVTAGKTMGKPGENPGKPMGKPWENEV